MNHFLDKPTANNSNYEIQDINETKATTSNLAGAKKKSKITIEKTTPNKRRNDEVTSHIETRSKRTKM